MRNLACLLLLTGQIFCYSQDKLTGMVKGEDGVPITKGNVFLYEKGDNGKITFVQKTSLTNSNAFTFQLNEHQHTLYFIPEGDTFGQYVPSVYGKTVMLQPGSFFTTGRNMDVVFEILKIHPLPAGQGIINGTLSTSTPNGRASTATLESDGIPSYPILLLSSSGDIVGYTHTNDAGFYEFKNLPRGEYKIFISTELDKAVMTTPYPVNITTKNANVNIKLTASTIVLNTKQLFLQQNISFTVPSSTAYGVGTIDIAAFADSNLPVSFSCSDNVIAEIIGNKIKIKRPGTVIIKALQSGNDFYYATEISKSITITKGSQHILFDNLSSKTFGDGDFSPAISSPEGLPILLTSSNPSIASVSDNKITILQAGKVTITASQIGNEFYNPADKITKDLVINKASQTISFDPLPEKKSTDEDFRLSALASSKLDVTYTSDNENVVKITKSRVSIRGVGTANITASQAGNINYEAATSVTRQIVVTKLVTGIEHHQAFGFYPNPVKNILILEGGNEIKTIEAYDTSGKLQTELFQNGNQIDMTNLKSGIYALRFLTNNVVRIIRVVKE